MMPAPSPRRIAGALDVLLALPPAVLQVLAERIVDRLDALGSDPDSEADDDTEAADDDEAPPGREGPWWPPTMGPAECCAVRLG